MHDDCPKEFQSNSLDSTKKVDFLKKERDPRNVIAMESVNPLSSWRNYNDVSIRRGSATNKFDKRLFFRMQITHFRNFFLCSAFKEFLENYFFYYKIEFSITIYTLVPVFYFYIFFHSTQPSL